MNQILIVRNLNSMSGGQERIMELALNGFITPDWMKDKGMFVCWGCGHIGCVDSTHCGACGDEKFIVTQRNEKFEYTKRKPYTRKMIVPGY
jgi:hypothetical protein